MKLSKTLEIVNTYRKAFPVDVEGLSSALGLVIHRAYLDYDISGMIAPADDGSYWITVNAGHPSTRQRFTIAHELGHYIAHKHLIGTGVDDDRAYRSTSTGRYKNTAIGPKEETEANRIAAAILMPYDLIEKQRVMDNNDPKRLAEVFGVSEHAMSICLGVQYAR